MAVGASSDFKRLIIHQVYHSHMLVSLANLNIQAILNHSSARRWERTQFRQRACHNSLPEEMMEPWINETVFIIVKKHKVIHTGDEDIKDDRDPTKTDSTDLDSNTWGNKLNYETHLDDMNTIRQRKKRSHGAHGEEKHNKHSPGAWHYSPLPEGASRAITIPPGRGERADRDQGGDEGRRRQERAGTGGAWRDPGHGHYGGPRWSRRREEPWRRNGRQLQGGDQW